MDEEPILDHNPKEVPTPPSFWPVVLVCGLVGGAIFLVFESYLGSASFTTQLLITILLVMIMLNSSLNFYNQRKNALQDVRTAIKICYSTFLVMFLVHSFYHGESQGVQFGYNLAGYSVKPAIVLVAGFLISLMTAVFSTRSWNWR